MKRFLKGLTAFSAVVGCSALAMAQDASGVDTAFNTFMTGLKDGITTKVSAMLPILGSIALIAVVIFLAQFVYRKVKAFMGR